MPVKWLMHWQPNTGATLNSQILTEVCQCVESINGAKDGRWKSQLLLYRPASRDGSTAQTSDYPRDVVNLVLHEQPGKCYFVIRGTRRIVFEAEASFLGTFKKLQSYKANAVFTFEENEAAVLGNNDVNGGGRGMGVSLFSGQKDIYMGDNLGYFFSRP